MNIDNSQQQMRKGVLDFCILAVIQKRKEAYPSEIIEDLKSAKLIVVEGTLYPLLTRLKNLELLTYKWIESNSGPPRKYYSITIKGENYLSELNKTWLELTKSVNNIINN